MTKVTPLLIGCTSLLALGLGIAPAHALNTRSFISADGSDANNCARTTPCRTLQVAHNNTIAGGEINMLDPAGYGTVTITKSISIVNDGVGSAGVLVPPGGTGITINAGVNDRINLRGLIIEGAGTGSTGIHFVSGKSLTIGKCIVRNLANSGIAISPSTPNVFSDVVVTDTILADNGGHGIYIQPSGNVGVTAVFNRVEAYSNAQDGIGAYANLVPDGYGVLVTVESSVAANNGVGFRAFTTSGQGAAVLNASRSGGSENLNASFYAQGPHSTMRVMHSHALGGNRSYNADDNALVYLSDSAATSLWLITNGATIYTYGDNTLVGGNGTLTPTSKF